jgi:hypothetical protein
VALHIDFIMLIFCQISIPITAGFYAVELFEKERPMKKCYWLRIDTLPWQKATEEQFVKAERNAGFFPKPGCGEVATGGFSGRATEGRITYGEITEEKYGWDPEFFEVATNCFSNA